MLTKLVKFDVSEQENAKPFHRLQEEYGLPVPNFRKFPNLSFA